MSRTKLGTLLLSIMLFGLLMAPTTAQAAVAPAASSSAVVQTQVGGQLTIVNPGYQSTTSVIYCTFRFAEGGYYYFKDCGPLLGLKSLKMLPKHTYRLTVKNGVIIGVG